MTKRCLRALLEESFTPGMEIILVDNGSSDDTVTKAKQEFPSITVLAAGGNFGFGRACNLGMTKAQGEFGVLRPQCERYRSHSVFFGDRRRVTAKAG